MKGLFIPEITTEMFRNGCLESIEAFMAEGEIYDIEYSRWIPVSERLPENSGNYLITYCLLDKTETQEAVYVKGEEDKWYDITDIEITLAVKAWMPLPEPYDPQESEKEEQL